MNTEVELQLKNAQLLTLQIINLNKNVASIAVAQAVSTAPEEI